jgi:hypothetical protein
MRTIQFKVDNSYVDIVLTLLNTLNNLKLNIIKNLSKEIKPIYGSGYSVRQLELMRQFYRTFPNRNALCSQLNWFQYKLQ